MKRLHIQERVALFMAALFVTITVRAQADSSFAQRFIHSIEAEARAGYIFPTNYTLKAYAPIDHLQSYHLRYAFRFTPHTPQAQLYLNAYQGIGLAGYCINNTKQHLPDGKLLQIGSPLAVYLFQGGTLARLSSRLSLNYEWNFGVSFGWKPYDAEYNSENHLIGSKVNAYLNLGLALQYVLSKDFSLTVGVTGTHFSNGNTRYPNSGLNAVDCKVGVAYQLKSQKTPPANNVPPQWGPFRRHISYDLTLYGSVRRKAVGVVGGETAAPGTYGVMGFSLAPMYNLGHKYRVGISLDGILDRSANIWAEELPVALGESKAAYEFHQPDTRNQMALGLSVRGEFVMPYFTVGIGLGGNFLGAGELKCFYQTLALKIDLIHNSYLHIGYNLRNFHDPNYLMLGVGYRFL
ncbi:MAG: acyloxyacyl hydrolase [Bacteroides sp.]|nr:acyloxyacyl hydrolase [Bacteroides sp.]